MMVLLRGVSSVVFCFLIAINDLSPKGVKISMFADDMAIWNTGSSKNIHRAVKKLKNVSTISDKATLIKFMHTSTNNNTNML